MADPELAPEDSEVEGRSPATVDKDAMAEEGITLYQRMRMRGYYIR